MTMAMSMDESYKLANHLIYINQKLLDLYAGRIKRLIINMPPRHGKSELISKFLPVWWLGNRPDDTIIFISYQTSIANEFGEKALNLMREFGKEYFNVRIPSRKGSGSNWKIQDKKGHYVSTGVGGALTGRGADLLILDDLIKNDQEAMSLVYRNRIYNWLQATTLTRLSPNARVVFINTRWHDDDVTGRLLENSKKHNDSEQWHHINLPAFALENDLLNRKLNEPLWPGRFDSNRLNKLRLDIGNYWFSALYQQQPISNEYQIFKPQWWKFYNIAPKCSFIVQSWDTAFKKGQDNDFSVCCTYGISDGKIYLLDMWRGKLNFPELLDQVKLQFNLFKPNLILMEDAASGQDIIPTLRQSSAYPIKEIKAISKEIRAHIVSPVISEGKVLLPENTNFISTFINEHSNFPKGKHDDIVDSSNIAIEFLISIINSSYNNTTSKTERVPRKQKYDY